jgi:hypothetical protein
VNELGQNGISEGQTAVFAYPSRFSSRKCSAKIATLQDFFPKILKKRQKHGHLPKNISRLRKRCAKGHTPGHLFHIKLFFKLEKINCKLWQYLQKTRLRPPRTLPHLFEIDRLYKSRKPP